MFLESEVTGRYSYLELSFKSSGIKTLAMNFLVKSHNRPEADEAVPGLQMTEQRLGEVRFFDRGRTGARIYTSLPDPKARGAQQ